MPPSIRLLALFAAAASLVAAQSSVYVPGPADEVPGAALVNIGAGVDGYTTYLIDGATLQANADSAIMTQFGVDGLPTVYNCALGADAQATCSVQQGYGVPYTYVEPITYFGDSTGQLPAAFRTTATPLRATPTSRDTAVTTPSATPAPQAASANKAGPAAGQAQPTGPNVFGGVDDSTGAADKTVSPAAMGKMVLGSMAAAIVGGAMLFV